MTTKRDITKYYITKGKKIVHTGITNDFKRREAEHRYDNKDDSLIIQKVGRAVTLDTALKWEAEQRLKRKPARQKLA